MGIRSNLFARSSLLAEKKGESKAKMYFATSTVQEDCSIQVLSQTDVCFVFFFMSRFPGSFVTCTGTRDENIWVLDIYFTSWSLVVL